MVRVVQDIRKELDLDYTARITVGAHTDDAELRTAIGEFEAFICNETLCDELQLESADKGGGREVDLSGARLVLYVSKVG